MSTTNELPMVSTTAARPPDPTPAGGERSARDRLITQAKALSWLSLAWMTVEGAVAITAALIAGSVALLGFGIDSAIEGLASVIVIWRLTGSSRHLGARERQAQKAVAVSFFLLAPYIAQDAIRALINGDHASTSWVGIGLSISSIVVMPLLGRAKQRLGGAARVGRDPGEGPQKSCAPTPRACWSGWRQRAVGWWWLDP